MVSVQFLVGYRREMKIEIALRSIPGIAGDGPDPDDTDGFP